MKGWYNKNVTYQGTALFWRKESLLNMIINVTIKITLKICQQSSPELFKCKRVMLGKKYEHLSNNICTVELQY